MPSGNLARLVNDFIKELKGLMLVLAQREPNDPHILRAQKRLVVASDMSPMVVVERTGEALFVHNESIYSDDPKEWAKFFEPDRGLSPFADQLRNSKNDDNRTQAEYLITRIQAQLRDMKTPEQRFYIVKVRALLDMYIDVRVHPK
jgi:hypothetical protein